MAAPVDCPGCTGGEHEKHDPKRGVIPGLIGGSVCVCKGNCAERVERGREAWAEKWSNPFGEPDAADEVQR